MIFTFLLPIYGLLISRFHGGGFKGGVNKTLKNFLWSFPFALATLFLAVREDLSFITIGVLTLIALALGFLKGTGHGTGISLPFPFKVGAGVEKLEYLILPLKNKIPTYWYKFAVLVLTGLAAVSGGVIAIGYINPIWGLIIAIGGVLKGAAYTIGWKLYPEGTGKGLKDFDEATEIGEALTGLFAYSALLLVLWL